jgi:hypothetical protein
MTEDEWQAAATAAAIAVVRKVAETIPIRVPIEQAPDRELGWVVLAVIFAWVAKRSEQAVAEGRKIESALCKTGQELEPWEAGAVAAILPKLAELPIDWSVPLGAWSRESMVEFLARAFALICRAETARDLGGGSITRKPDHHLDDPIPL